MTIGWEEILLLMVFALVIFGPKRLPEIARQVGRFMGEVRRVSREFEREVRDVAEPFEKDFRDVAEPFHRELRAATDPEDEQMRTAEAEAGVTDQYALDADHSTFLTPGEAKNPPRPPRAV